MELQGVTLRPVAVGDGKMLAELHRDHDVWKWIPGDQRADYWIARGIPRWIDERASGERIVDIVLDDVNEPVGMIQTFRQTDRPISEHELVIAILPTHRGRRYAQAAVVALIDWLMATHGIDLLLAVVHEDNGASCKLSACFDPMPTAKEKDDFDEGRKRRHWVYRIFDRSQVYRGVILDRDRSA